MLFVFLLQLAIQTQDDVVRDEVSCQHLRGVAVELFSVLQHLPTSLATTFPTRVGCSALTAYKATERNGSI